MLMATRWSHHAGKRQLSDRCGGPVGAGPGSIGRDTEHVLLLLLTRPQGAKAVDRSKQEPMTAWVRQPAGDRGCVEQSMVMTVRSRPSGVPAVLDSSVGSLFWAELTPAVNNGQVQTPAT